MVLSYSMFVSGGVDTYLCTASICLSSVNKRLILKRLIYGQDFISNYRRDMCISSESNFIHKANLLQQNDV